MDILPIAAILTQDGVTSGAIYTLLALALVLVFVVTRVIFFPQGEFITYGALSLVMLQLGKIPPTVWALLGLGVLATVAELAAALRRGHHRRIPKIVGWNLGVPTLVTVLVCWAAPRHLPLVAQAILVLAVVTPMGPLLYRVIYQPMAEKSVLVLMIVSVGVHFVMLGLGLLFFGPEGAHTPPFWDTRLEFGNLSISGQSVVVVVTTLVLIAMLWLFFEHSFYGKALRATAVNRLGARLLAISTDFAGKLSFALAAFIGSLCGLLIAPITTIYYDSGFLIGLKSFVAAVIGGLASYPLTALGALFIGLLESFSSFGASSYKESIVFLLVIPVLLWLSLSGGGQVEEE